MLTLMLINCIISLLNKGRGKVEANKDEKSKLTSKFRKDNAKIKKAV